MVRTPSENLENPTNPRKKQKKESSDYYLHVLVDTGWDAPITIDILFSIPTAILVSVLRSRCIFLLVPLFPRFQSAVLLPFVQFRRITSALGNTIWSIFSSSLTFSLATMTTLLFLTPLLAMKMHLRSLHEYHNHRRLLQPLFFWWISFAAPSFPPPSSSPMPAALSPTFSQTSSHQIPAQTLPASSTAPSSKHPSLTKNCICYSRPRPLLQSFPPFCCCDKAPSKH